jgi:hypothetical protein
VTTPLVICLTLVFPLIALLLAKPIAERAEPRTATWLLTASAVGLAASSGAALTLAVLAALIRLPLVAALGRFSPTVVDRGDSTGVAAAAVCGLLLGVAFTAVVMFAVRRGRALAEAFRHARGLPGRGQIVVTGDASADAYTVPGWPGRIVVSAGMLDSLDDAGRAALLAHERAHLAGRHYAFTSAARLAAAANPLLRPLADAVEYTVERWADECAAQAVGDRRLVAETIARAAVAAKQRADRSAARRSPIVAMGAVFDLARGSLFPSRLFTGRARDHSLAGAGPVPRRVAALLAPPPGRRWILQAVVVLVVSIAAICATEGARDLHELIETAQTQLHH